MGQITLGEPAASSSDSEISPEINTVADLVKLWAEGRPLTNQKLKELNVKIKTFKEIVRIKDCLRLLKNCKRISKVIKDPIN